MIERHFHWRLWAYNGGIDPVTKNVNFPVTIDVIGYESEADATIAAQAILPREHYVLQSVWECGSCGYQNRAADMMDQLVKATT